MIGAAYSSCIRGVAFAGASPAISASRSLGSSYRVHRPSRSSTPSPPRRPTATAVAGLITESIGAATIGMSKWYASICQPTDTSSGSRVRREGTTATSSKE